MLPKAAVLSNEEQTEFWIMKLLNDSVAVKTGIQKGIESGGNIQVISPPLGDSDRIILTGNYGLSDTAKIKAVSYTHLRAHETPEHLVCRLLLEKKNMSNSYAV